VEKLFRFQDLDVWQRAADMAGQLGDIADALEARKRYRFAEQLRSAALSISNNIAEGSGSGSKKDFRHFLNMAHRSGFECANMVLVFDRLQLLTAEDVMPLLVKLQQICRMIIGLSRSLE
jgi:four helix bundle protein